MRTDAKWTGDMLAPGLESEDKGWIVGMAEDGFLIQGEHGGFNQKTAQPWDSVYSVLLEVMLTPGSGDWRPFSDPDVFSELRGRFGLAPADPPPHAE